MKRIAELRKAKNWNQIALGLKLNVSQYLISAYETGRHQPSIDALKEMSKLFNVSVDYIIENTDVKAPAGVAYGDNLSSDAKALLNVFHTLSQDNRQRAIGMLMALQFAEENEEK